MFDSLPPETFSLFIGYGWIILALCFLLAWRGRRIMSLFTAFKGYTLTPRLSRLLSRLVGSHDLSVERFLHADGVDDTIAAVRRSALQRLADELNSQSPLSHEAGELVRDGMSDLRFADANRVPFPFAKVMRESFNLAAIAQRTEGPYLVDMDGNRALDVSGSYGVNVAGYDRYKEWQQHGWERVKDLGPVLGPLHPIVTENIRRLKEISGQEEVSFHTSGTEAVMAAVRLARFNTQRKKIVCFDGAYHGWWDGVQPGLGSERGIGDCLTLSEMRSQTLKVIRSRRREIAGVLINPVQSFHPNSPPPNDAVLFTSDVRQTQSADSSVHAAQRSEYAQWLKALRALCSECDIPLIFDEVYSGFRLAAGGAQAYYGVRADMVLYGKTVAAGLPIGVVCGQRALMRRFDPQRPMRIAYVVGTFSAYPAAMGAMHEFLTWVTSAEGHAAYETANRTVDAWADETNRIMQREQLPIRIKNLATIWTVQFSQPSRFNWLLQYYLRAVGVNLSWVGTGRCLVSLDYTEQEFESLTQMLRRAALRMVQDKWWLSEQDQPDHQKAIRKGVVKDMAASLVPSGLRTFYGEVMRRKHDDHEASHSDRTNQFLHLISSSIFIYCYWLIFSDLVTAMWLGLGALFIRQIGHALIEPPCHDAEQLLLGFDTRSKSVIVAIYLLIPTVNLMAVETLNWSVVLGPIAASVAQQWFWFTAMVVFGRVVLLIKRHGFNNAMVWFVKLVTDPFTDIKAYYGSVDFLQARRAKKAA